MFLGINVGTRDERGADFGKSPFMDDPSESFALSPEQQDTAARLEELLGRAIANRYIDFSRIVASATGLRVSRPIAAHALRELESMIRSSLQVPMDAKATIREPDVARSKKARIALKQLGYDDEALQRFDRALAPQFNHATQIERIAKRLGFSADSDIAVAWKTLCTTVGRAHERYYHRDQPVDEEFRAAFQRPFELVLRGLVAQLPKYYDALMRRVEELARMSDYAHAAKMFRKEIPGAPPLQWHFFQTITSPQWLPHLLAEGLVGEPLSAGDNTGRRYFREWPVGHYLLAVAKSGDIAARPYLIKAIKAVSDSKHIDVRRHCLDIIAALPPDDIAELVGVVTGWLDADSRNFYHTAPEHILKRLAESGHIEHAFRVTAALFQVFEQGAQIASIHPLHMYEHNLPDAVALLAAKHGLATVRLFSQLLRQASIIERKVTDDGSDYTYVTPHSLAESAMSTYGIYEALIIAVRDAALIACSNTPANTSKVIGHLKSSDLKIFKRIALHVLSKNTGAAPLIAAEMLSDSGFIGEDWCEDEYAELAVAYFPALNEGERQKIFSRIEALPERFRALWKRNFAAYERREPSPEDERRYEIATVREAMWKWRAVLPAEQKQFIDASIAELGDPDARHLRLFPSEVSPLAETDLRSMPIRSVLTFLSSWEPTDEPVRKTITALGQQLRNAVEREPQRFAEAANEFASMRPIYVRRLLEGFDTKVKNNEDIDWAHLFELIRAAIERLRYPANTYPPLPGDDADWLWCAFAAAALLKSGLRRGNLGIPYHYSKLIESIILLLFDLAPRNPNSKDFEQGFKKHPYFAAEQTLWGSSIELCMLFVWWNWKQPLSPLARKPQSALTHSPSIPNMLERSLSERTEYGMIPRAIMGRYLSWLRYFGEDWLQSHTAILFPDYDDRLRRAAWLGHLLDDSGPVIPVLPEVVRCYLGAIRNLGQGSDERDDQVRENRLGDYILILFLKDANPAGMVEAFWEHAPEGVRAHVLSSLGRELQLPAGELSDATLSRARAYWKMRLSAAMTANNPQDFRKEIGVIGQWFVRGGIDPSWLLTQLLEVLRGGFAPNSGYSIVKWLASVASSHPDETVHALWGLLNSPNVEHWTFTTERAAIRTVLEAGSKAGNPETRERVYETVGLLAAKAETNYLDLGRPLAKLQS
jgi:hypothetical protein